MSAFNEFMRRINIARESIEENKNCIAYDILIYFFAGDLTDVEAKELTSLLEELPE